MVKYEIWDRYGLIITCDDKFALMNWFDNHPNSFNVWVCTIK